MSSSSSTKSFTLDLGHSDPEHISTSTLKAQIIKVKILLASTHTVGLGALWHSGGSHLANSISFFFQVTNPCIRCIDSSKAWQKSIASERREGITLGSLSLNLEIRMLDY